ncbi:hypothetical protein TEA_004520 [Camellia sinensis var. sinensis]|uniref:Protein SDA1 n=1 Tax=Camellia sinensis var. sinensis TaxID=542762 RepID=A0A4S4ESB3_CAMSN|nr:hypothetical protein TEA_004520 [Camellia sinensis var. sinensis]
MSTTPRRGVPEISPESLSASGRTAEKLSLPTLQSKMKCDPEGYETELTLLYAQFKSSLELFQQQAALNFTSVSGVAGDPTVAKDLGDRVMFLAHVTPFYRNQLSQFPKEIADFLGSAARTIPSSLRCHIAQALILLINRKMVDIRETLALFMELQTLGDRVLRKLAFSHVVHSVRRMNQKHKNDAKNRALQNILFTMLQQEDEAKAKQSLITLCDLHRRKVWFDDRTANAICTACFHPSSRIMIAALSFLLDYENIEDDDDSDSDGSSSEDDSATQQPQVVSREAMYKAHHKGTSSSKKKKKAKLQRAIRSMKRQQRMSSEKSNLNYYSPLSHLKDAQGFAEKLFSRLQTCNERFEIKMMMLKVIARTVGLHRLILLNFYPYLQKYVQPHQRDVTTLLAAAVQACHDMAIAVGLNAVREICLRMPLRGMKGKWFALAFVCGLGGNSGRLTSGNEVGGKESKAQKRKFSDFDGQLNAADTSLRALKRLAGAKKQDASSDPTDGILSNEDFQRIKELNAKKEARIALAKHGLLRKGSDAKSTAFKVPSSDQLSVKRVDPAKLEAHIKKKLSKEERLELIRAGREERGKYQARAAVKQKKTGGSSNRQKEHKKAMPLAAKRSKVARSKQEKKKKQQRSSKQFRGRKAWK